MSKEQPVAFSMRDDISQGYATIAVGNSVMPEDQTESGAAGACCSPTAGCCAPAAVPDALARDIGYDDGELTDLPEGANLGLSCGNPTAIASLSEGDVVIDLGSGAGFDCFLASPKVGATGQVIGVDMTHEMLGKARANNEKYQERTGRKNVEFRLGEIEHLPIADSTVDVVLSNCVINLSTDKEQVWHEIARVLKPGGRVSASDMALFKDLPDVVRDDVLNWTGCVGGAIKIDAYQAMIEAAGLQVVALTPKAAYVESLMAANDPFYARVQEQLQSNPAEYITSLDIQVRKPVPGEVCTPGSGCC
jgi:ubiquinone/menaquinone biosynthesis C-methylase UbiE